MTIEQAEAERVVLAAAQFAVRYGATVANALAAHSENMRKDAASAQQAADTLAGGGRLTPAAPRLPADQTVALRGAASALESELVKVTVPRGSHAGIHRAANELLDMVRTVI